MAASPTLEHANTVGWYILEGYPWWPVYICDQFKLRPKLHMLGDGHKKILKKARDFKKDYALVYYFGSHDFSLVKLNKGILKPWDCSEKEQYLKGHPKHLMKKSGAADDLQFAIQEVEDYLSQPEDMRLPPHMVPSDLDPTLEPPPPMERPEEEEEAENADDDDPMASDGDDDADEDADMEDDEDGAKKKTKPKKASTSKSTKKEKKATEKKPKKESVKKEKKPAKEKKTPVPKETKEKKEKPEKKTEDKDKDTGTPSKLKRQRSSASATGDDAPAAKQAKKETATVTAVAAADTEDMSVVLEREIRWVLSNAQYEEMTTKMLRKVLEERLKRDLKQHRDTIKAVVARVIDEEEDGAAEGEGGDGSAGDAEPVKEETVEPSESTSDDVEMKETKHEEPVKNEPTPETAVVDEAEKAEKVESVEEPVKKEEHVEEQAVAPVPSPEEVTATKLQEATAELTLAAAEDTNKIVDVLQSLKKLSGVTKSQLSETGLLPKLVELRVHRKRSIATAVGELATLWEAEAVIPAPKPVDEEDIVPLREKLANAETPHDELLAILSELQEMPLEMSHLRNSGIARVVAGLRQHANDKVSIAAKNLRNAWMQLAEKGKQPNNLKKLEKLNEVLESEKETEEAKLSVLHKLIKLSLTTQEIIESKIGVMVSKLRKSSNEQVVQAANKLRKKWKSEAEAS